MVGTSAKDCNTLRPFPVHTPHRTCMFRARIHPSQIALSVHTHTSATIASCHLTPAPLLPPAPCVRAVCTRQRSRVPLASQASPAPCSRGPAQGADDACAAGTCGYQGRAGCVPAHTPRETPASHERSLTQPASTASRSHHCGRGVCGASPSWRWCYARRDDGWCPSCWRRRPPTGRTRAAVDRPSRSSAAARSKRGCGGTPTASSGAGS